VRHDWGQKDSPVYLVGSSSIVRDTMRQLELRTTVGAGLGYRGDRYRSPGSLIEGQVLGRYESVELMLSEESARRLSSNTSWQQRPMVFPNLSTSGAFRATFESVLSVAMSRNLNLTLSLIDRYDSQATAPLKKNDVLIFTGIKLQYGARQAAVAMMALPREQAAHKTKRATEVARSSFAFCESLATQPLDRRQLRSQRRHLGFDLGNLQLAAGVLLLLFGRAQGFHCLRLVEILGTNGGIGQHGHHVGLHFEDAAGDEHLVLLGLARLLDAHDAGTNARDQRRVLGIDAQLARLTRQHDKVRLAREDAFFGGDDVNVDGGHRKPVISDR
jgi:hypothetical protein